MERLLGIAAVRSDNAFVMRMYLGSVDDQLLCPLLKHLNSHGE